MARIIRLLCIMVCGILDRALPAFTFVAIISGLLICTQMTGPRRKTHLPSSGSTTLRSRGYL